MAPREMINYPGGQRFHFTETSINELAFCSQLKHILLN